VPVSGKVIGTKELQLMVEASLDGWLTTGRFNALFEERMAKFLGVNACVDRQLGLFGQLGGVFCPYQPKLGDRAIQPGDEVIGVAAGFPPRSTPFCSLVRCRCLWM